MFTSHRALGSLFAARFLAASYPTRRFVANVNIPACVISLPRSSPVIRPSHSTQIRSDNASNSGISLDTKSTAPPRSANARINL
jgi:hypothetical protein